MRVHIRVERIVFLYQTERQKQGDLHSLLQRRDVTPMLRGSLVYVYTRVRA